MQITVYIPYIPPDDGYQTAMPWRNSPKDLPNNYETAQKQLVSTEKGLM